MARTRTERLWVGGGSLAVVLLAIVGWLVVVSPKLSSASSLRSQKGEIQLQNDVLQGKINKLKDANANMAQLQQALKDAAARLPSDAGLAAFTNDVQAIAASAQVSIATITAGSPSRVVPGKAAQAQAPTATAKAIPGALYSIPITLSVNGTPAHDINFLNALQRGTRAALVTATQLTTQAGAGTAGAQTTLTLQLQVFSAPQAQQPTTQPAAG
jgi:hypothetical protein